MPTEVSVRQVRDAIYRGALRDPAAGPAEESATTTLALGQLFHEVFAKIVDGAAATGPLAAIADCDVPADDDAAIASLQAALTRAAYREIIGPRLDRDRATLTHSPDEVLVFWEAVGEMCGWLARVLLPVRRKHGSLAAAAKLVTCEQPLDVELSDPTWSGPVVLKGTADAVIRVPGKPHWCVIEIKTGRTAPEADIAQAALYHMMLPGGGDGAVGLVSFKPQCVDRLVSGKDLVAARESLKALIGALAGVAKRRPIKPPPLSTVGTSHETPEANAAPAPPQWKTVTDDHRAVQRKLAAVLASHGLSAKVDPSPLLGPTFARFLVSPTTAIKVAKFTKLGDELALGLDLANTPMVSRIGGKIAVDIERPDRHAVSFDEIQPLLPEADPLLGNPQVLVGVDMEGTPVFADVSRPEHCHILVAGTAGSGKSMWLRSAIASLVETNSPETLELVLIDPKRNAFTAWKDCPHLRTPIVFPDETPVLGVLDDLIEEMEARYTRMANVDDLTGLVRRDGRPIPRIVCVCDEYADLVAGSGMKKEIEGRIARLGSKARAAGIHLILATQTPRRDIISGAIKANLPTCVALRVASAVEARILEAPGAELLLGNGDLLFKSIGPPTRLQGIYLPAAVGSGV